jgi:hypothetical protein
MKFEFNSRETYLAYRAQWSAHYQFLIASIRESKQAFKEAQRGLSRAGIFTYHMSSVAKTAWWAAHKVEQDYRADLNHLRGEVQKALQERQESKEEAGRQMELARTAA